MRRSIVTCGPRRRASRSTQLGSGFTSGCLGEQGTKMNLLEGFSRDLSKNGSCLKPILSFVQGLSGDPVLRRK